MLTKRLLAPLLALTIISACTSKENRWTDRAFTGEATGVVWKFPVTMGDIETTFKAISPNGYVDEIIILPLQSE